MKKFIVKTLEEEGFADSSLLKKEARLHLEHDPMLEEEAFFEDAL